MEIILQWLAEHAQLAPFAIFGLLVIAGFSLPISEDLLLLASGMLAATVMPEKAVHLFLATFLGSLLSDIIAYALGRSFGDSLPNKKWFGQKAKGRIDTMRKFYKKYGIWTLIVGRCIPFGVRNAIFMTAGVAKMRYMPFIVCDTIACFFFSSTLFLLAYSFGSNFDTVCDLVHHISVVIASIAFVFVVCFFFVKKRRKVKQPL